MRTEALTKVDQIVQSVLDRVEQGALKAGQRLRSIREEAGDLNVAKNTVVEAYLRLVAQGVLVSKPGSGYYVSRSPVGDARARPRPTSSPSPSPRTSLLTEQLERKLPVRPGDGRLPSKWLDSPQMRRPLAIRKLSTDDTYNVAWGLLPLRQMLSRALVERGITAETDQIFTTYGGNHALDLIIRCRVRQGDAVLVDDPGYYPLFWKLELAGANIIGVNRLHDGPDVDDLRLKAAGSGAKIFFTQSLAHNPTGGSLTLGVAYSVLKAAEEFDLTIVEDDPFADILPLNAVRLAALDQLKRVIYVGSFSKTLPGSVRVGYVAAAQATAQELNDLKITTIVSTSAQNEQLVFTLIEGAHYLKYLRKLRDEIHNATSEMVDALEKIGCNISRPLSGGYYLWVRLPDGCSMSELTDDAAREGIFIAPSEAFATKPSSAPAIRINVAYGNDPRFLHWLEKQMLEHR